MNKNYLSNLFTALLKDPLVLVKIIFERLKK